MQSGTESREGSTFDRLTMTHNYFPWQNLYHLVECHTTALLNTRTWVIHLKLSLVLSVSVHDISVNPLASVHLFLFTSTIVVIMEFVCTACFLPETLSNHVALHNQSVRQSASTVSKILCPLKKIKICNQNMAIRLVAVGAFISGMWFIQQMQLCCVSTTLRIIFM